MMSEQVWKRRVDGRYWRGDKCLTNEQVEARLNDNAALKRENEELMEWMGEDKLAEMSVAQEFRRREDTEKTGDNDAGSKTIVEGKYLHDRWCCYVIEGDVCSCHVALIKQVEAENDEFIATIGGARSQTPSADVAELQVKNAAFKRGIQELRESIVDGSKWYYKVGREELDALLTAEEKP